MTEDMCWLEKCMFKGLCKVELWDVLRTGIANLRTLIYCDISSGYF
jgi:hypothetical protein